MTGNSNTTTMSSNREMILTIVTGGIALALAFVLSQIKLFELPNGGTVTPASILPIVIFAMAFGPGWGFVVAVIFSLLQLIGGWLVTPFQVLLDYTLGYSAYGLIGFAAQARAKRIAIRNPLKRFANAGLFRAIIFTVLAYVVRWFCSVLSGVIFYAEYAGDMNPWIYSMIYNGSFLSLDLLVLLVVMIILYVVLMKAYKKPVK